MQAVRLNFITEKVTNKPCKLPAGLSTKLYTRVFKYMNLESFLCSLYGLDNGV